MQNCLCFLLSSSILFHPLFNWSIINYLAQPYPLPLSLRLPYLVLFQVANSMDVACAACEALGTLVSSAGAQGIKDFDKSWGEGVLNKSIKTHWLNPHAASTCCLAILKILPSYNILINMSPPVSLCDHFEGEGIPSELIKMIQWHFWNAEFVGLALRLLADFARIPLSQSLNLMSKTKGMIFVFCFVLFSLISSDVLQMILISSYHTYTYRALTLTLTTTPLIALLYLGFMPLMIRVSEHYKGKPAGKTCEELYDLFFREEMPGSKR